MDDQTHTDSSLPPASIVCGVDLLEIGRMQKSIQNPHFLNRVFSAQELDQYQNRGRPTSFLAGCFCGKEAFAKALGTGVRNFSLCEISVLRDKLGAPFLLLEGRAQALAQAQGLRFSISLSNTREHAMAFVVGYRDELQKGADMPCG